MTHLPNESLSKINREISELSDFVDRYDHDWNSADPRQATCCLCGRQKSEVVGGCLINAAGHRQEAPKSMQDTLSQVRPYHPAMDLMKQRMERYLELRWQRNTKAIQLLGLENDNEYIKKAYRDWIDEYWKHHLTSIRNDLQQFSDLFAEAVSNGAVQFRSEIDRARLLRAFTRSNNIDHG